MRHQALFALLLVSIMFMAVGCSTAAPGVTNQAGTYIAAFDAKPEKLTKAAQAVCEELKLTIVTSNVTALDGYIEAKTAQDREVTIKVSRLNDTQSQVSVRVGVLGDGELSTLILDKIKQRL